MPASPEAVERIRGLIREHGFIPAAPTGPVIGAWDPMALANGIEAEVNRFERVGQRAQKITLNMDPGSALELARALRRIALLP